VANPWDADVAIDAELAKALIADQFPQVRPVEVQAFATGWDNAAFLVDGTWVFRFPRRKIAVACLENETRSLPGLAPVLPLLVPVPAFVGRPDRGYPYPFAGYLRLPGTTGCEVDIDGQAERVADDLGAFLRALHNARVPDDAPVDTLARTDLRGRAGLMTSRLAELDRHGELDAQLYADDVWQLAKAPAYTGPPCWVHGDLYARHVLFGDDGLPSGVIDWGDVHVGDPALDLSIARSFLPPSARPVFKAAYGPIDEGTWQRAGFRALHYGIALVLYGLDKGDLAIERVGRKALSWYRE
jgi:aminoglycoside phosphotransferase (APT) family kinase protein